MSRPAISTEQLTPTLVLCECHRDSEGPRTQPTGWWLYDKTRGMNLAMRALTREAALIQTIMYYQKRLTEVEAGLKSLSDKVDNFVGQFVQEEDKKDW